MRSRLYLDVDAGETVTIGGSRVTLQKKSGARARLLIESEDEVALDRGVQAPTPRPAEPAAVATPAPDRDSSPRPLLFRPGPA